MHSKPVLLAFALSLGLGTSVFATSTNLTFNFNSLASGATAGSGTTVQQTSLAIQNYMNAALTAAGCTGCSVIVGTGNTTSGGNTMGAVADQTYSGDYHVVGPVSGGKVTPVTLGTTDGATNNSATPYTAGTYDTFIANTTDASSQLSSQITLRFVGVTGLTVTGFDYEIFPDATGQTPDMIFEAGNGTGGVDNAVSSFGTAGTQLGVNPAGGTDGSNTKSCGGSSGCTATTETNLQYIGHWSGTVTGASEFDFVDWPATIGVDNLAITFNTSSSVPEPTSILLLGTVAVGLLAKKLRKA